MRKVFIESMLVIIGLMITIPYILFPNPYLMFLFVFIAQPCIGVAVILALYEVYKDLTKKDLL
ncbi:hypothetical protein EI427_10395 [Flammeovirga pectinis]|uniref:Uncharacterized protein n=1 Tax=Flammeovirga pectinis TaxID=2494373 RepID=A0A3Q9FR60_9BACT|nr:hypothetical protein [Flammeovirga pectinis]AZQ62632.1 hypothetical protein EI427_10395 [Flammeovirga pectinis]